MKKVGELRFVDEVPAGAVGAGDIADGAVTGAKIAAGAVTIGKIAAGAVDSAPTAGSDKLVTSGGVKAAIDDAVRLADVIDDKLVPTEGPGTSEVFTSGGKAATYLAEHLPAWTCNGTAQSAILRNRYGASPVYYHYDLSLFTDRLVFWVEGQEGGAYGAFTRSIVFPKSGVYTLDIEYAAGYAYYPNLMGQARFVVDAGTSGAQDVIGINDPSIVQHARVQFAANAGAGSISVKGKTGLEGNNCCVVIASLKVTLVKEIGVEIGDIVAPDADAQTGQAADAKATHEQLVGKADRVAEPTDGNLASLDENGNLEDSGYKAADFVEKGATNILIGSGASKANNVTNAVVIGVNASANGSTTSSAVAIGNGAKAKKTGAIQLGAGENSEEKSLRFRDTVVVGGDGKIPTSSLRDFPALESVPDRAIAASTAYAVGDVLGDGGKAYRCKSAYTSAADPVAPGADTAHWAEVPVLADKEDAANKVTSLTSESTDAQYPSAKCVYDALQGAGAKPTRIYNGTGTDALDDKGRLFDSGYVLGGWWDVVYVNYGTLVEDHVRYVYDGSQSGAKWVSESDSSRFIRITSDGINWSGQAVYLSPSAAEDLDPTDQEQSESLAGVHSAQGGGTIGGKIQFDVTAEYHPQQVALRASPYGHFALESVPDREYSNASAYAVGDLVKYGDPAKAYRCNTAIGAPEDWTAAHWTEVPTLATKASRPTTFAKGHLAKFDLNGDPVDSGVSLDVMTQAEYDALGEYDENTVYVIVNG